MAIFIPRKTIYAVNLAWMALLIAWLFLGHAVTADARRSGECEVEVTFRFLAPMRTSYPVAGLNITDEFGREAIYKGVWVNRRCLVISIQEQASGQGLKYLYRLCKAPAVIWPFSVSGRGKFATAVAPRVVGLFPESKVPTRGPVVLQFNTPVEERSFHSAVRMDVPGKWEPAEVSPEGGGRFADTSRWLFYPERPLEFGRRYKIVVGPGVRSLSGLAAGEPVRVFFDTAPELLIMEQYPEPGAPSIWLSRNICIYTNQKLKEAVIEVDDMGGQVDVEGEKAIFVPDRCFRPSLTYKVRVSLTSVYGERLEQEFSFSTTKLGSPYWLEVKRGDKRSKVWIMKGGKEIKEIDASFARHADRIPAVTMYESWRNRGLDEENRPWFALNTDILIHALPDGMKEDDHEKLGLPRSYSCILIPEDDVKWIARHFENGFMVIVR